MKTMKLKHIFSGFAAMSLMLASCVEADVTQPLEGVGVAQLSVKGLLVGGTSEYETVIDPVAGTITVRVPYYISDTDPIMGDLTQMKIEAQLPTGYMFSPSISGIHDLAEGFKTNLVDRNGGITPYVIKAEYFKSAEARVISAKLVESERTAVVVKDPESEDEHGQIIVVKTSSTIDGLLHEVMLSVSPWATISSDAFNAETNYVDFAKCINEGLPVTIIAQDGVGKKVYDVVTQIPDIKAQGIGYVSSMWAKQLLKGNDEGWETNANASMAIVDDYLIVSNANDFREMLVFDRFNGKRKNIKVNCTGIPDGRIIRAITNDDANHMVAGVLTSNAWMVTDPAALVYVWKDGIENKPTPVLNANIRGSYFTAVPGTTSIDVFCTINCKGDMTQGNAVIMTAYRNHYGGVMIMPFVDGKTEGNCIYEGNSGVYGSTWDATNVVPMTTTAPWSYFMHSGNGRGVVSYIPVGTGNRAVTFLRPKNHWWGNNQETSAWCGSSRGIAYTEFNGCCLLAIANGNLGNGSSEYHRLYVADVTASPNTTSLQEGFLFDSREGDINGDAAHGGPAGTGYGVAGMTSKYPYNGGEILGDCLDGINRAGGNVIFGKSSDGNAVQVYMLIPDHGILSFEITRFDI